jgi:hypothetical protein
MDPVRVVLPRAGGSPAAAEVWLLWILKGLRFDRGRRAPASGCAEVFALLVHLAMARSLASSAQCRALCALLFVSLDLLQFAAMA